MTIAYLGLGSNLGDRVRNLAEARRLLAERGARPLRESAVRETEPFGVIDQPRFLNQVIEVEWPGTPRQLLDTAKEVEVAVGRTPTYRWGPREIDVDILLFGHERVDEPGLVIPHPGLHEREFVRVPLAELRPDLRLAEASPSTGSRLPRVPPPSRVRPTQAHREDELVTARQGPAYARGAPFSCPGQARR